MSYVGASPSGMSPLGVPCINGASSGAWDGYSSSCQPNGCPPSTVGMKRLGMSSFLSAKRTKTSPSGVPLAPFVAKLFDMVNDPGADECIYWSNSGNSFWVTEIERLEAYVLPSYFKHNRMAFFVKQLRSYGFRSVSLSLG